MNLLPNFPTLFSLEHKSSHKGNITFLENPNLENFSNRRSFWISQVPDGSVRGVHAHRKENQVLVCLQGEVEVLLEDLKGAKFEFRLQSEGEGLFVPKLHWQQIKFLNNPILMVFADKEYSEADYIRDKKIFDALRTND